MALLPKDFGPIYAETNMESFPVEPCNTLSNLVFLAVIIYWGRKTKLSLREYPLIVFGLALLLPGFIGGTLYHALRNNPLWLYLDFVPIIILVVVCSIFFWIDLFKAKPALFRKAASAALVLICLMFAVSKAAIDGVSFGYLVMAACLSISALAHCASYGFSGIRELVLAITVFAAAILCRVIDGSEPLLPMGTHFLWHIFGGLSVFFLIAYLFQHKKMCGDQELLGKRSGT